MDENDPRQIELDKKIKKYERMLDNRLLADNATSSHSMKTVGYGQPDKKRATYAGHKLNMENIPNVDDLSNATIILVDDNLVDSNTMGNAIKLLFQHNINPINIFGFVLHKFVD